MAYKIKKNDLVEVIAGDHRGEKGKVLRVIPGDRLVVIEGVNMVFRHVKPSRKHPQGGRIQKEAPLAISNVLPVDPKTGKGSRVRFEMSNSGNARSKKRTTTHGTILDEVTQASE